MNRSSLFKLVDSLTPEEVTDFRCFVRSTKEVPGYLRLFDLLLSQGNWNDGFFRRKLQYTSKQLANQKHYLETRLIQFLTLSKLKSPEEWLRVSKLFLQKGLDGEATKAIHKGKRKANDAESFGLTLEFLELQKRFSNGLNADILEEEREVLRKLYNLNEYRNLRLILKGGFESRSVPNPKISPIEQVKKHDLVLKKDQFLSIRAEYEYLKIKTKLAAFEADYVGVEKYALRVIQLLEENSLIFTNREEYLVTELAKLAHINLNYGQLIKSNVLFDKIQQVPEVSTKVKALKFEHGDVLRFILSMDVGDAKTAGALFLKVNDQFRKFRSFLPNQKADLILYNLAYFKFLTFDYREARKLSGSLTQKGVKTGKVFKIFAHIISITSSMELGDFLALESDIPRLSRFLNLHSLNFQLPRIWTKLVTHCEPLESISRNRAFSEFLKTSQNLRNQPNENRAFKIFDAEIWVNAKLERTTPLAIRKKAWRESSTKGNLQTNADEFLKTAY